MKEVIKYLMDEINIERRIILDRMKNDLPRERIIYYEGYFEGLNHAMKCILEHAIY